MCDKWVWAWYFMINFYWLLVLNDFFLPVLIAEQTSRWARMDCIDKNLWMCFRSHLTSTQKVKASACNAEDPGMVPGSGRSPGEENGNPLQYSCLENSMNGGAWWATVHGVAKKSDTSEWLFTFTASTTERGTQLRQRNFLCVLAP